MALDPSRISIVSSTKVSGEKLTNAGDTVDSLVPPAHQKLTRQETCCPLCCVVYGSIISTFAVFAIAASGTAVSIFAASRIHYTINGTMRQIGWIAFPGLLVGASLQYFMAEAMWSNKRNSWGQAWFKAIVVNSAVWCAGIGIGTVGWRRGLPLTAAGRRLYHRYPIPSEPLEARVLRSSREFFTGMGTTYWLSGVACGQLGFVTCVSFCVAADRPYLLMAPQGGYASRCMPPWRRQQLGKMALGSSNDAAEAMETTKAPLPPPHASSSSHTIK